MTLTVFFNIFTGWRAADNVTIKASMITSGRFRMNFAVLVIIFTRRRRPPSFLLFSAGFHLAKRLQFFQL